LAFYGKDLDELLKQDRQKRLSKFKKQTNDKKRFKRNQQNSC